MLEQAMISGVTHTVEENVYRVEETTPSKLFSALAEAQVNVDTILVNGDGAIVFSAPLEDHQASEATLNALGAKWSSRDDLGKVSVIGAGMKSHPGVAAKTFDVLGKLGIEPVIVSTSPIKIACHIAMADVERAVQALHAAFELDTEVAERGHE